MLPDAWPKSRLRPDAQQERPDLDARYRQCLEREIPIESAHPEPLQHRPGMPPQPSETAADRARHRRRESARTGYHRHDLPRHQRTGEDAQRPPRPRRFARFHRIHHRRKHGKNPALARDLRQVSRPWLRNLSGQPRPQPAPLETTQRSPALGQRLLRGRTGKRHADALQRHTPAQLFPHRPQLRYAGTMGRHPRPGAGHRGIAVERETPHHPGLYIRQRQEQMLNVACSATFNILSTHSQPNRPTSHIKN